MKEHPGPKKYVKDESKSYKPTFYDRNCKKDHGQFVPLNQFNKSHLPPMYRDNMVYQTILSLSKLTIRLVVSVNEDDTKKRLGTGTVTGVNIYGRKFSSGYSGGYREETAFVEVTTACHVVSDSKDASKTTVELFYDEPSRKGVMLLKGSHVIAKNEREDWCTFICMTKNVHLANDLKNQMRAFKLQTNFLKNRLSVVPAMSIVVSHAHGGPKHVFIEELHDKQAIYVHQGIFNRMGDSAILWNSPTIVTGKSSEEVGIECEVVYPDGTTTFYPIWQMDRLVKYTKHELFMQGGLRDFREDDLHLEIELPTEKQVMDDNKTVNYYKDDLSRAVRIHMKQMPIHFETVVRKSPQKGNVESRHNFVVELC